MKASCFFSELDEDGRSLAKRLSRDSKTANSRKTNEYAPINAFKDTDHSSPRVSAMTRPNKQLDSPCQYREFYDFRTGHHPPRTDSSLSLFWFAICCAALSDSSV